MDRINLLLNFVASLIGLFCGFFIIVILNMLFPRSTEESSFALIGSVIVSITFVIPITIITSLFQFIIFLRFLDDFIHSTRNILIIGAGSGLFSGVASNLLLYRSTIRTFDQLFFAMTITGLLQGIIMFLLCAFLIKRFNEDSIL
jgi:hypothetical protein